MNILKFVRRRLESTVERCSVERCCILVILFTWLSSHRLQGYTLYVVHIFKWNHQCDIFVVYYIISHFKF